MSKRSKVVTLLLSVLLIMGNNMASAPVYAAETTEKNIYNHELESENDVQITGTVTKTTSGKSSHSDNSEIGLNSKKITINIGDTYDLDLLGTAKTPYWTSWNVNKVRVDQDGVVTGIRAGSTTVTARVGLKFYKCTVKVVEPTIKLNKKEVTIYTGGTATNFVQLKVTTKGVNKDITWESKNPEVATVDHKGKVTSVAPGKAVIVAHANGKEAACKITVKETAINLNLDRMQLSTKGTGSSIKLVPTIVGSNKKVIWQTSDKNIAVVSGGKVTGKNTGEAVITATSNGVSVTCNVIVKKDNISINEEAVVLYNNEIKTLKSNVGKKDKPIWTSSNTDVVTVNEKGTIQAVGHGSAVITVSLNGSSDTCQVQVDEIKTRIGEDRLELHVGKSHQLGLQLFGRSKSAKWTSSDKKVVTVNNKGKVVAKKAGKATVTATANGVSDTVEITVKEAVPSITLNYEDYVLYTNKGNTVTLKAKIIGRSKTAVWSSSDETIATVTKGKVKALKAGEAVITVTANGISEDCTIMVRDSKVILGQKTFFTVVGDVVELPVDVVGQNQKVSYKSSDNKIATVKNGVITAKALGEATIKVTANGVTEICAVYVDSCLHEWNTDKTEVIKTPTCSEIGELKTYCNKCQKEKRDEIATVNHNYVEVNKIEETCTVNGVTSDKCSMCDDTRQTIKKATGHNYGAWVTITKPSNFTEGIDKCICSDCGIEEFRTVPAVKHEENEHNMVKTIIEPNCTEEGYTEYSCDCGYSYTDQQVDALGHNYENGVCIRCGESGNTDDNEDDSNEDDSEEDDDIEEPNQPEIIEFTTLNIPSVIEKNSVVELEFSLQENVDGSITEVYLNNEWKSVLVEELEESNFNKVLVGYHSNDVFGLQKINITKLKIGDKEYDANISESIEILKSCYTLENIKLDGRNLSFAVKDDDNSFLELEIVVKEIETENEIFRQKVDKEDKEEFVFNINNIRTNKDYTVYFYKKHVLDLAATYMKNTSMYQTISLNLDYDSSIGELKLNRGQTYYNPNVYGKNEKPSLKFNNTDLLSDKINKVVVNNKEYDVTLMETEYMFYYDIPDTYGEHIIYMTKIILEGGAEWVFKTPRNITIQVLKDAPTVGDITVRKLSDYNATLDFTLMDQDDAIQKNAITEAVLIKDNNIVGKYPVVVGDNSIQVELEPDKEYIVEIKTTYVTGNGIIYSSKPIKVKSFDSPYTLADSFGISDLCITNNKGVETSKFAKGEQIQLQFTLGDRLFKPTKVVVNGNEYSVTTYGKIIKFKMTAPNTGSNLNISITGIVEAKGRNVALNGETTKTLTIVKNSPCVDSFSSLKKNDTTLTATVVLADVDNALTSEVMMNVLDVFSNNIYSEQLTLGSNTFDIPVISGKDYRIEITGSYKLSDDLADQYTNALLYVKGIHVNSDNLDLKDIESMSLYKDGIKVEILDISGGIPTGESLNDYYLEINPVYTPKLYANVREFREVENKMYVIADLDNFITYYKDSLDQLQHSNEVSFEIEYTNGESTPKLKSAEELINQIKNNPTGKFVLTEDLDASGLTNSGSALISVDFQGTLDGKGFTIYNLEAPLFAKINAGTIQNLNIVDANVANNKAILAISMGSGAVVDNIVIDYCNLTGPNGVGLVAGGTNASTIKNVKITNSSVSGSNTIGAIAGELGANSVAEDCFVEASVSGTLSHSLGSRTGGITGWLNNAAKISRCYTDVALSAAGVAGSGGLIGGPQDNGGVIENCISIASGTGKQIAGFDAALNATTNTYQLSNSKNKNVHTNIGDIDTITKELFVTELGLKLEYWNILEKRNSIISADSTLRLIPEYAEVNILGYNNIMKIAPFLSSEAVISMGNKLTNENMRTKEITGVYAFDSNGSYVMYTNSENALDITTIKVVYDDTTFEIYNVNPLKVSDNLVAMYSIEGETIPYHFNSYIMNDGSNIKDYVVAQASNLDFAAHIEPTVTGNPIRLYADVYNTEIKEDLDTFAEKLVYKLYPYTIDNTYIANEIKDSIDSELLKELYTYTYYRKSFDFDIGGINIADLIFFNPENLDDELSTQGIINSVYTGNRAMNSTYSMYSNVVAKKTGLELYDQLELFIRMSGTNDYNQWFLDNWDGYVKEQEPVGYDYSPNLNWRIWDNLTNLYDGDAHLLHLLTVPKEIQPQLGVMSTTAQLLISDVNIYYQQPTEANIQAFRTKFDNLCLKYGRYYGTSLNYVENGEENLNNDLCIGYDTVIKYANPNFSGLQNFGSEAPFVKYICEPANRIYTNTDTGAVATGKYIYYGYMYALDSFGTFTHENAHNQDSDYFMNKLGRRSGISAEYFAEGFFTEPGNAGDGDFTANRISQFGLTDGIIANRDFNRINSLVEIQDYYSHLFDAWYGSNALFAKAVLDTTPAEHYKALFKVRENSVENGVEVSKVEGTYYKYGPWDDELAAMNIKTFADLYDAKVAIRPIANVSSGYDRANFWDIIWYTPENKIGVSDPATFKTLGYEMLGYKGWTDGLVAWASNKYQTDDQCIKAITGYDSMRDYKIARYTEALDNLDNIPYFDSDRVSEMIAQIYRGTKRGDSNPSLYFKAVLVHTIKRVTNDFLDGNFYEKPVDNYYEVNTAEQFVDIINRNKDINGIYIKLTNNIDLSGIIGISNNYYMDKFVGIIDGDGYAITGINKPLFNFTKYAIFSNLTFEGNANTLLSNSSSYTLVYDSYCDDTKTLMNGQNMDNATFSFFMNEAGEQPIINSISGNSIEETVSENSVNLFEFIRKDEGAYESRE